MRECRTLILMVIAFNGSTAYPMNPEQKLRDLSKSYDIGLEYQNGALQEVFIFDVDDASVVDSIVEQVKDISGITTLHLENVCLSELGAEHVQSTRGLRQIVIRGGNVLLGKVDLSKLTHLHSIKLKGVRVSGRDVRRMRQLVRLEEVELQSCSATDGDELLQWLLQCSSLRTLMIRNTKAGHAAGHGPLCTGLRSLDLGYSGITDSDLQFMSELRKIECLILDGTTLTSACLETVNHASLRVLDLSDTNISRTVWRTIGRCGRLESLTLAGNEIDSDGIEWLLRLRRLQELNVSETQVDDKAIPVLCKMKNLDVLFATESRISVEGFGRLVGALGRDVVFQGSK